MPNNDFTTIIAIDGPAASGKSTIASRLAKRLRGCYVSTGSMYRAVTLAIMKENIPLPLHETFPLKSFLEHLDLKFNINADFELKVLLDSHPVDSEIRSPNVSRNVSEIAKNPLIRKWLVEKQRSIAQHYTGYLIMEGRDIGTVVFPKANVKFYLTATPLVRAQRRLIQTGEVTSGSTVTMVAEEIALRDLIDTTRSESPLRKADDAELVDSSDMTIHQVVEYLYNQIINGKNGNENN